MMDFMIAVLGMAISLLIFGSNSFVSLGFYLSGSGGFYILIIK